MPLRFINPNYHVILIHYPLGVFVLGVFLELFSFLWRRSKVRIAAKFMIVVGALLTLPAATSGIYALSDVAANQGINDARYALLRWHVIYMGIASLLAVFCAVVGLGSSNKWRRRLYFPLLLGVVGAWALMVVGAWHGGETIYQNGTSVAIVKTVEGRNQLQDINDLKTEANKELPSDAEPDEIREHKYNHIVNYYVGGELQQHLILAGFAFAFAFGALGLSMRRLNSGDEVEEEIFVHGTSPRRPGAETRRPGTDPRRVTDDISVIRSFNPDASVNPEPAPGVPAGRFWLLSALLVLLTLAAGYWVMYNADVLKPESFETFKEHCVKVGSPIWPVSRHVAHFYLGAAFFVLTLLCGLFAWLAPKRPIVLAFVSILLILVIAAQVWMGVLLTFDGSKGPLNRFRTAADRINPAKNDTVAPTPAASEPSTEPTTAPEATPATAPATAPATGAAAVGG